MIGIGITTRNRPIVLELAMEHWIAWPPPNHKIVVIDDNSMPDNAAKNTAICMEPRLNIRYHYSDRQLGIAGAKNACLWELQDCGHTFLFDDDAFPGEPHWWYFWIHAGVPHLTFAMDVAKTARGANRIGHVTETDERGPGWQGYTGCLGCCLYFSRRAKEILGNYNPRFGVYGFEHCQITQRAHNAGLSPALYTAPVGAIDSIYTLDMHLGWLGIFPPLMPSFDPALFNTSVTPEEAADHKKYSWLMNNPMIHYPLEDWHVPTRHRNDNP